MALKIHTFVYLKLVNRADNFIHTGLGSVEGAALRARLVCTKALCPWPGLKIDRAIRNIFSLSEINIEKVMSKETFN